LLARVAVGSCFYYSTAGERAQPAGWHNFCLPPWMQQKEVVDALHSSERSAGERARTPATARPGNLPRRVQQRLGRIRPRRSAGPSRGLGRRRARIRKGPAVGRLEEAGRRGRRQGVANRIAPTIPVAV